MESIIYTTRKKAAAKPPLFSRPFGQLVGLCPTCLFYSPRHGRLGLIEVFPFLSFFYSPRSITIVLPFGHQGLSLWSLRVFPLVIKVPHLHLHSFEVKCDKRRTKNERTDRTESRTMSVISIDVVTCRITDQRLNHAIHLQPPINIFG